MKKILVLSIISIFSFLPVYAELGVNLGVSGNMAVFHGTGQENENGEIETEDATGVAGWGSIFVEKTLGSRFAIGIDYVPDALESETQTSLLDDLKGTGTSTSVVTQKIRVDFEDMTTVYAQLNVTENLYVKVGAVNVDVITKESLGTGSTYGDTNLEGTSYGIGYNHTLDNGIFWRIEGNMKRILERYVRSLELIDQ
jgi:hypothetical protein